MSHRIFFHRQSSPVGPLLLLSDGAALVGLYTPESRDARPNQPEWTADFSPFRDVSTQLERYFAGELTVFDVPLAPSGTPFQRLVWSELLAIPCGTTISYQELALRIANPRAVRAVGGANGKNPISIIVPCHRVIGANGQLVGYGGGLACKRWLLAHERAIFREGPLFLRDHGSSAACAAAATR
jgi:methylated-DNA-[protein]-cysteine S-methyltransferase